MESNKYPTWGIPVGLLLCCISTLPAWTTMKGHMREMDLAKESRFWLETVGRVGSAELIKVGRSKQ